LSTGNVSKFKHRLLTRDDVFTRADAQPIIRGVITGAPMRRPPNTRLKLSAPVLHGFGEHPDMRCGSIPFVNLHAWRRSLSAVR
jgi:hypothetical protein